MALPCRKSNSVCYQLRFTTMFGLRKQLFTCFPRGCKKLLNSSNEPIFLPENIEYFVQICTKRFNPLIKLHHLVQFEFENAIQRLAKNGFRLPLRYTNRVFENNLRFQNSLCCTAAYARRIAGGCGGSSVIMYLPILHLPRK